MIVLDQNFSVLFAESLIFTALIFFGCVFLSTETLLLCCSICVVFSLLLDKSFLFFPCGYLSFFGFNVEKDRFVIDIRII